MARGNILLVDDEIEIVDFFRDYFEEMGFNVVVASNGEEGLETFAKQSFDLVISDMMMPRMIGMDFLKHIKKAKPEQKLIFITGVKEESMLEKAKELGCYTYITKPVTLSEIEAKVSEIFPEPA